MDRARLRILIVEDEPAHAEAIRRAFEAAGPDADDPGGGHAAGIPRERGRRVRRTSPWWT